ncbi:MAG TPA: FGGY family carbohydrate kinase [Rectinemataceae bacterium]|nr:FGGY family carbohydrate kinase [Rectinemataceae bacterium]
MGKALAVIDIGMTNKKVAIYNLRLELLAIEKKSFEPLIAGGIESHDLAGMESWFFSVLKAFSRRFDIAAIAVCTHGATFVCTDAKGEPVLPCFFYTHEPGEAFQRRFYAMAGDPEALQAATGTPNLSALINPAKGLFFARELYPRAYEKTELALPYPQYWGMRLTGKAGVEGTYIGCHTYLYDWNKGGYSSVAEKLGLDGKLPSPLRNSWEVLGTILPEVARRTGLSESTIVTMGIHDSNASLLPYLVKGFGTEFIVNSTGTWCVLMHPQEHYGFVPEEIGKVVFFNRSAYNKPVKTAIFLGGKEYEVWTGVFRAQEKRVLEKRAAAEPSAPDAASSAIEAGAPEASGAAARNASVYADIVSECSSFILPEIVPGSGQFPGSIPQAVEGGIRYGLSDIEAGRAKPAFLADPAKAKAVLNLSIALQTIVALERAGLADRQKIFTEGGFRNNAEYNAVLAAALPENPLFLTDMSEATSFGTALTGLAALEGKSPSDLAGLFSIAQIPAQPMRGLGGFEAYKKEWLRLIAERR